MRFWLPTQTRRMSFTGGVILWFFFWWLLIPAYLVYALVWVCVVVVVNVALNLAILTGVAVTAIMQSRQRRRELPR